MKLHSDTSESGHACASVSHAGRDMNPNLRSTPGGPEAPALPINGSADQSEDPDRSPEDADDLTPEIQQAFRIFQSFLSEKHKSTTAPFWRPIGPGSHGPPGMSFRNMHDKFASRQYESITAFVADFRLMLENCYRFHGVDHWISKQAQKLEIILEQKLTLLSRTLREKTTLAVTSRGRFGTEDEKVPVGTSSRRRLVPRNLASITVGSSESIMVQALRLEELQRAKDEKRQRELERKEAGEASVKELEEWESSLLALAEPWPVRSMWELPAVGHFLCLAQTALGLPEIVFYELERCLLMPRCSSFLAKVMTSLLCPPHKRASVLRRPPLPYGKWEAELRRRVQGWYRAVGRAEDQLARAEHLGLCHQFFWTLGEASPLEQTAFHLLPFVQRVWLLKGLCDHVYETQKDVQDAVLNQPIHECRESILGYDGQENAYIHFPHFCGADLRIYCQSPCAAMEFPLPPFYVRRSEEEPEGSEVKLETYELKDSEDPDRRWSRDSGSSRGTEEEECEPRFTVGESRYKAVSPALNTHTSAKDTDHMTSCPEPARVWTEPIRPGISRLSRERVQKKRKHVKKSFKKRTANSSFQRAAASVRKRERRNRRKLAGNGSDAKVLARRPIGPSFQLICSSLDDLRLLISKTEDQLEELDDGKKRSERRPNKRVAVKELHVTLIRLLNELLPWEPKLVKAFQRNRARLKKECDDFKKQPEYENFIREQTESKDASASAETAGEPGDGEGKMDRDVEDESEAAEKVGNQETRWRVDRAVMHPSSESGPFTRSSKRSGAIGDEASLRKTGRSDSSASEVNVDVACRERAAVIPRVSALPQPSSSFQGSCKPIQALLAKSVGNKVTLTSHPKPLQEGSKTSVTACPPAEPVSTEAPAAAGAEPVVYKTAGGVGLLRKGSASVQGSAQMISDQKSVFILPSNLLTQSAENKADKKTMTYLSNASGFTIPENKVPVQQVAPLKNTCIARTPSAVVTPNLRSSAVPKKPLVNESASPTTPDAKQELRTVCIRDSQSILVTTRGGNTGVVKVQTSESGAALPSSPVFAISPQLQAFLMSKSSTVSAAPQSLPTDAAPVKSSTFVPPSTLSQISNDCTSVKTSIPGKSALLATSKDREAVTSGFQQNTVSTCGVKKRPLPGRGTLDQSAFQKVFLVSPSPNIPSAASNLSTTTGTGTLPGSRVMFISNSIRKEAFASELNVSSTSTPALKVMPKLGTTLSCTSSGTNIGVPGSMSNKSMPSATEASVIVSRASASGGFQMGQKNCLVASRGNAESSPKVPGSVDGKMLTFSTLGSGHMASSALLSVVKPDVPSSVNALCCKPELMTASSTYSGSLISKHTTLPVDATSNKTPINTSFCSSRSLINTTSSAASSPLATSPVVMTPRLRHPTSTTKNIHEKIVINTTAPLAPGTQLLINNTRFVVPPQGLGPGSHVLLINSYPAGLQGSTSAIPAGLQGSTSAIPAGLQGSTSAILAGLQGSTSTVPAGLQGSASTLPVGLQGSTYAVPAGLQGSTSSGGPNSSTPHSGPSGARGVRLVTPIRLPSPNIGPYDQVQQLSSRSPLNVSAPALSQIAQALHPGVSSEIVRLPVFQTSGVSQEASPLRGLPSTTSAVLLQGRPSQTLVVPAVPPMKPAMAHHSPMATVPHVSRMQRLPVAMVPPIGAPTNASPATPIASVPPSMNSVVMTPCPPVRAVQPGTVGKPAILPQPMQALNPVLSSTKLLLSPNGAILNIVRASSSGVGMLANTRVVCSSSSSVSVPALSTNDTLGKPETLGRPDH